jgi:hypothetical protein
VDDEERTGEGMGVATDDGKLGELLLLPQWRLGCTDFHTPLPTLTNWDQTETGARRVPHRDASLGVHGDNDDDEEDITADGESSRFASVEEVKRAERATAPGWSGRRGWSAVDADGNGCASRTASTATIRS